MSLTLTGKQEDMDAIDDEDGLYILNHKITKQAINEKMKADKETINVVCWYWYSF